MGLCDLCLSIPYLSLPSLPPKLDSISHDAGKEKFIEVDFSSGMKEGAEARDPFGFAFHRDLNRLGNSASSCPLCKLVYAGVRAWSDMTKDAAANDFRRTRQAILTDQQLWLTSCSNGQQGFYVWVKKPTRKWAFYLLTVVGFSVESSQ